jgi:hypothetical protein
VNRAMAAPGTTPTNRSLLEMSVHRCDAVVRSDTVEGSSLNKTRHLAGSYLTARPAAAAMSSVEVP